MNSPSNRQEHTLRLVLLSAATIMLAMHYGIKPTAESPVASAADTLPTSQMAAKLAATPPPPYIAHAGGLYEGRVYTNSVAALEYSYREGHRLMEVDLHRTLDHQTVLLHDWEGTVAGVFDIAPGQRTLAQFRADTAGSRQQPAQLSDFVAWAQRHPDVRTILDTKTNHLDILREIAFNYPDMRSRFVPYIYSFDDYQAVQRLGYANVSLLIRPGQYEPAAVLQFAKNHYLHSIAMQPEVLQEQSPELKNHVPIYCWTINDSRVADQLRTHGLYGVITDSLKPAQSTTTTTEEAAQVNLAWISS